MYVPARNGLPKEVAVTLDGVGATQVFALPLDRCHHCHLCPLSLEGGSAVVHRPDLGGKAQPLLKGNHEVAVDGRCPIVLDAIANLVAELIPALLDGCLDLTVAGCKPRHEPRHRQSMDTLVGRGLGIVNGCALGEVKPLTLGHADHQHPRREAFPNRQVFASGDHERPWELITPQRAIACQAASTGVVGGVPCDKRENLPVFGRAEIVVEKQKLILELERLTLYGVSGGLEVRLVLVSEPLAKVRDGQVRERRLPPIR
jgi:hypothetical protein